MEIYKRGRLLNDNEYLIKIAPANNAGYRKAFMTKLNKDGSLPRSFLDWPFQLTLDTFVRTEQFSDGWKFVDSRYGESQNWAILLHPDGFTIEIHLDKFLKLLRYSSLIKHNLIGRFKWEKTQLIMEPKKQIEIVGFDNYM